MTDWNKRKQVAVGMYITTPRNSQQYLGYCKNFRQCYKIRTYALFIFIKIRTSIGKTPEIWNLRTLGIKVACYGESCHQMDGRFQKKFYEQVKKSFRERESR